MSSWIDKAKDFIKGNPDKAKDALEKAEDMVNERTGGKYAEQVDQGSDMVGEKLGLPPETEDATAPEPAPSPGPAPVPSESPAPTPKRENVRYYANAAAAEAAGFVLFIFLGS